MGLDIILQIQVRLDPSLFCRPHPGVLGRPAHCYTEEEKWRTLSLMPLQKSKDKRKLTNNNKHAHLRSKKRRKLGWASLPTSSTTSGPAAKVSSKFARP